MPHPQKRLALALSFFALLLVILFIFVSLRRGEKSLSITGPIRYNCELSGGTFQNERCTCQIEDFQTQELMYDKDTGFCQSTIGGPAGDADYASTGIPHGEYEYMGKIVMDLCSDSGGSVSGLACICPSNKNYNKTNGKCE